MTQIGDSGPVAVLLNPSAGRGRHRDALPGVLERLRATGREVTVLPAGSVDEALASCRGAVASGVSALVAVGGDGTIHLGLQAVAGTGIPFGVVPAGTGNDFVVELGLPDEPVAAAAAVTRALDGGSIRKVDLGRLTDAGGNVRWFGAVLAAGFDAIVSERANRMRFPRGPRRYDVAIVAEMLRLRPRRYTMVLDGVEHQLDAVLVAVGNTARYGGGMRITPDADPTDGLLDVVVGGRLGRVAFARIKPHVYQGTHVGHPLVTTYRAATVELRAEGIVSYVDGERAFPLPVTATSAPGALTLLA
ncbi:YegS/Rv2252/BmrU family lipid kinase [Rugosimonospora acidiphila]|uniref:YegS/Rv2252/BmrU family lipid kinase n=1 Tax=Rugosimonospora acidiphila TaxID=556531 RepID=A0ABP9RN58_9ACTN